MARKLSDKQRARLSPGKGQCPFCRAEVSASGLQAHIKKAHPNLQSASSPKKKVKKQLQQVEKLEPVGGVIIATKRGSRVLQSCSCNECGMTAKQAWRYTNAAGTSVYLCDRCKPIVYNRSHGSKDAMDAAVSAGHFEGNRSRH